MKKRTGIIRKIAVCAITGVFLLAGCGNKDVEEQMKNQQELIVAGQNTTTGNTAEEEPPADVTEETGQAGTAGDTEADTAAVEQGGSGDETVPADQSTSETAEGGLMKQSAGLPIYSYHGSEPYMDIVTGSVVSYAVEMLAGSEVYIPSVTVVGTDDSDASNIRIWGYFDVYGYNLNGTTLETQSSAVIKGCMHLAEQEGSYVMTAWDQILDEDPDDIQLRNICDNDESLVAAFHEVQSYETRQETRKAFISEYVSENALAIDGYQDYGADKTALQ